MDILKFLGMGCEYDRELKILKDINHPFCLKFIEKILYNDHVCFITEYYPHGDLEKLIVNQNTFTEEEVLQFLTMLLL